MNRTSQLIVTSLLFLHSAVHYFRGELMGEFTYALAFGVSIAGLLIIAINPNHSEW